MKTLIILILPSTYSCFICYGDKESNSGTPRRILEIRPLNPKQELQKSKTTPPSTVNPFLRSHSIPPFTPGISSGKSGNQSLSGSGFKYNSDEEKAFWKNLPDWTAILTPIPNPQKPYPAKRNSLGDKIEENATNGFNGYVKSLSPRGRKASISSNHLIPIPPSSSSNKGRIFYEFVDGYVVRYKFIDIEGKVIAKQNFKYGIPHGLMTEWYENGQKSSEGKFKNGKKQGSWTFWSPNGQKGSEGSYNNGKKHGFWVEGFPTFSWLTGLGYGFTELNYKEVG